jgi:uncharacterized protein DUF2800
MKHSGRKHSEFSPSSAKRWISCPGSVRLSRLAPPQRESPYAREGTEAHECLEFIVRRYRDIDLAATEARKKYPTEMVDHAVNSARRLFSADLRPSKMAKLLVESRVILRSVSHRLYGTLDYAWIDLWGTLTVVDYKYGAGEIVLPIGEDGKPNPQLMLYALGIAEKHEFDFEAVKIAIIQPRVWQEDGDSVTHATVSIKQLREFQKEVKAAVKEANRPDAPLYSGDHCKWCPALATCPEQSSKALAKANILFDVETGIQSAPAPLTLTAKSLPQILDACRELESWIKAVRDFAYKKAEDGEKIPGYKLVAKRAQRVWLPGAEKMAKLRYGTEVYRQFDPEFLSPAQLEKKFGDDAKKFTVNHTASVSSGFNLVSEKERGEPVESTVPFDFDE